MREKGKSKFALTEREANIVKKELVKIDKMGHLDLSEYEQKHYSRKETLKMNLFYWVQKGIETRRDELGEPISAMVTQGDLRAGEI